MFKQKASNIILLLALFIVTMAASAISQPAGKDNKPQPGKNDNNRVERRLTMLKEKLNLSEQQTDQIKAILEDAQKQRAMDSDKKQGNPEAAEKIRAERRKATVDKIMAVLNDDQKKEFEKMKDDFRGGPPPEGKGGMRNGQGDRGKGQGSDHGPGSRK
jgi:Spy/CpxP family protein refolding chaperone